MSVSVTPRHIGNILVILIVVAGIVGLLFVSLGKNEEPGTKNPVPAISTTAPQPEPSSDDVHDHSPENHDVSESEIAAIHEAVKPVIALYSSFPNKRGAQVVLTELSQLSISSEVLAEITERWSGPDTGTVQYEVLQLDFHHQPAMQDDGSVIVEAIVSQLATYIDGSQQTYTPRVIAHLEHTTDGWIIVELYELGP